MALVDHPAHLEVLTPRSCRELLATTRIGRVAVVVEGHPEVFPVVYALDDGTVVFSTESGSKLHSAVHWPSVAFEADEIDLDTGGAWSVMVVGPVTEIIDGPGIRRCRELVIEGWAPLTHAHWLRITPTKVTGRRLRHDF